jgi:steroid 5-alpha reductase family enzyme
MYGLVAVFVFAVLLAALGEIAFRVGDLTGQVGETGAAILLGMTAIALAILVGSILHSLRQR